MSCLYVDGGCRTVGDPVDVVTGANTDITLDFKLRGPLPLFWRRYYSSAQNHRHHPLGWGHTHEFDHWLQFDMDGLRYTNPAGRVIGFPALRSSGGIASRSGTTLLRLDGLLFQVRQRRQPVLEFRFTDTETPARLTRVLQGRASIQLYYDAAGYLKGIRDSSDRNLKVECDRQGRVLAIVYERPLMVYRYDAEGNLVQAVDAYGHELGFRWDGEHRMAARTDRRGYTFLFEYDRQGRCVLARGEDALHETRLSYRPEERRTIVTRADGGRWNYLYNEHGNIALISDPYGGQRAFVFNEAGRIEAEMDPNGNRIRYLYDGSGPPVAKQSPQGRRFRIGEPPPAPYPARREPHCALQFEYGDTLPFASIKLPAPGAPVLDELPESARRLIRTVAPLDFRPGPVFNDLGVLIKELTPSRAARRWSRDPNGNVHRYHDAQGAVYTYEYGSWNLRVRLTDPLGGATTYRYTSSEQLAAVTDPGGTTSEYEYNCKDRCIRVRRHGAVREQYRYDLADNLVEKLDADGNRLLEIEIGPGNLMSARHLASGENHYFEYDKAGRYLRAATDEFEVKFAYDGQGRRTLEQRDGLGVEHRFERGRLAATTIFGRFVLRYTRDRNSTITIEDAAGRRHRIRFVGHGLVERTYSNGSSELAQYDSFGRCLLKVAGRRRLLPTRWSRLYAYSEEGELLREEDGAAGVFRYEYDAAHRLTAVVRPDGMRQEIVYDAGGNLLRQPGLDGVTMRDGNRLVAANGATFDYDGGNHMTARKSYAATTEYTYDSRGMLTSWRHADRWWTARYDPIGRRVSKASALGETRFWWDNERLAAETAPDGRLRIYVYADVFAITPLLFLEYESPDADPASGQPYFIFANQVGAPVLVEDEDGEVVWSARLDPYGAARVAPGAAINMPLRFPGHYFDAETELHYNRFRYYSPELGRYLQSDPHGIAGGLNVYAYPANPLVKVDVRGLACPDHPAGFNPNCDDCTDDEPTHPNGPPGDPDPATVAAAGDPSEANTWRPQEVPYQNPPEIYQVGPGHPLDMDALDTNQKYLWVVDPDGNVLVAPENQPGFGSNDAYPDGRPVKHGDLTPGPDGLTRGPARGGGEMQYNPDTGHWEMNNDSSYTFNRADGQTNNGDNLQASHDLLTQSGTDTSNIDTVNSHGEP